MTGTTMECVYPKRIAFTAGGMNDLYTSTEGYSTFKFRNLTRTGGPAPHADQPGNFSDIDFPLFRLGEIYLIYAEAVLRQGTGGDAATALNNINKLRARAYGNTSGNITAGQLTTDFILDERTRELFGEYFRWWDLVRTKTLVDRVKLYNPEAAAGIQPYHILRPIPQAQIDLVTEGPKFPQNQGY